jgi:hypothetical protein
VTDPEFHSEPPSTSIAGNGNSFPPMQTFVFSATLSKGLQQNLKKRWRHRGSQKNNSASTLDDLLSRLDFRDAEPEIDDLSPKGGVVPTLKESRIECLATDKVRVLCSTCPQRVTGRRMSICITFFCDTLGARLFSCHQ